MAKTACACLVVLFHWSSHQLDVQNVFLHGNLCVRSLHGAALASVAQSIDCLLIEEFSNGLGLLCLAWELQWCYAVWSSNLCYDIPRGVYIDRKRKNIIKERKGVQEEEDKTFFKRNGQRKRRGIISIAERPNIIEHLKGNL